MRDELHRRPLIIGVGNEYRRDDAVGIVVVRGLKNRLGETVAALETCCDGATLSDAWRGAPSVVVFDASRSGATPGSVQRFDAREREMPKRFFHHSTHAFGLAEAVELSRVMGGMPPRLIVYGIEGRDFAAGAGLSAEVEAAARRLVDGASLEDLFA